MVGKAKLTEGVVTRKWAELQKEEGLQPAARRPAESIG